MPYALLLKNWLAAANIRNFGYMLLYVNEITRESVRYTLDSISSAFPVLVRCL